MSRDIRAAWRELVWRHKGIGNATRVLLLLLAGEAKADNTVSVPVSRMTAALDIPANRVSERIAEAKRAGLLRTVVVGCPGRTAVYGLITSDPKRSGRPRRKRSGGLADTDAPIPDVGNRAIPDVGKDQFRTSYTTDRSGRVEPAHAQTVPDVWAATTTSPQHSDVNDADAKAAQAAGHPSTPVPSAFSSRSPSGEPPKAEQPNQHRSDDEYATARQALDRLAPDRRDALMARAFKTLGNVSNRDLICYAADTARAVGEVA